jgi:hypothetical protein
MRPLNQLGWCLVVASSLTAAAPAVAVAGNETLRGVVVHRSPLIHRYAMVTSGRVRTVAVDGRAPRVGHRATIRVERGRTAFRQLGFREGPTTDVVAFRGVASVVDRAANRFVISDGYSSILIRHRLDSPLPKVRHAVRVRARFGPGGRLLEVGLADLGFHRDPLRVTGFVRYLVSATEATLVTGTSILAASTCRYSCVVISGDDAYESDDRDLLVVPFPGDVRILSGRHAARGLSDAAAPLAITATVASPSPPTSTGQTPIEATGALVLPVDTASPVPGPPAYVPKPDIPPGWVVCPRGGGVSAPTDADCPQFITCPPGYSVLSKSFVCCAPTDSACINTVLPPPAPYTSPPPAPDVVGPWQLRVNALLEQMRQTGNVTRAFPSYVALMNENPEMLAGVSPG